MFTLSADGYFMQWNYKDHMIVEEYHNENSGHDEAMVCMEICQRDKFLFIGGDQGTLRQWDIVRQS